MTEGRARRVGHSVSQVQVQPTRLAAPPSSAVRAGTRRPGDSLAAESHSPAFQVEGPAALRGQESLSGAVTHSVSSLITLGFSFVNRETSPIWVIKHLFEFSPESAVTVIIKQTWNRKAFILASQSSQ